jgi:amidohydrolase
MNATGVSKLIFASMACIGTFAAARAATDDERIARAVQAVDADVRAWRHDFHLHPELSNREFRTAQKVADVLRALGLEVRTGIAKTGVVALLKGGKPGRTIAYRADMDATLGPEHNDLSFRSTSTDTYRGEKVFVSHLCGHDAHTAMLMGVATVLAGMREQLAGNVVFIFQPAEEAQVAPDEPFGARQMLQENVLKLFGDQYAPEAIFGLHVLPREAGTITFREKTLLGSGERIVATLTPAKAAVRGHDLAREAAPADPVIAMARIALALKQPPAVKQEAFAPAPHARVSDIKTAFNFRTGGMSVELEVDMTVYDKNIAQTFRDWVTSTIRSAAKESGADADIRWRQYAPVLYNDPQLVRQLRPSMVRAIGEQNLIESYYFFPAADDVALLQERIPGIFMFLGVNAPGLKTGETASNHTPTFFVNEDTFQTGMRAMTTVGVDYLNSSTPR